MYLIEFFASERGWHHKIVDKPFIIDEFYFNGNEDLPIDMKTDE